jgi:hypothetical protein
MATFGKFNNGRPFGFLYKNIVPCEEEATHGITYVAENQIETK